MGGRRGVDEGSGPNESSRGERASSATGGAGGPEGTGDACIAASEVQEDGLGLGLSMNITLMKTGRIFGVKMTVRFFREGGDDEMRSVNGSRGLAVGALEDGGGCDVEGDGGFKRGAVDHLVHAVPVGEGSRVFVLGESRVEEGRGAEDDRECGLGDGGSSGFDPSMKGRDVFASSALDTTRFVFAYVAGTPGIKGVKSGRFVEVSHKGGGGYFFFNSGCQ
jgi:hypothetical protein